MLVSRAGFDAADPPGRSGSANDRDGLSARRRVVAARHGLAQRRRAGEGREAMRELLVV